MLGMTERSIGKLFERKAALIAERLLLSDWRSGLEANRTLAAAAISGRSRRTLTGIAICTDLAIPIYRPAGSLLREQRIG
jgi:hypothetical protein